MKKLYLAGILFFTPCLWGEDQVQQSDSMIADENSDNYGSRRHRRVHDEEADSSWWDGDDHDHNYDHDRDHDRDHDHDDHHDDDHHDDGGHHH